MKKLTAIAVFLGIVIGFIFYYQNFIIGSIGKHTEPKKTGLVQELDIPENPDISGKYRAVWLKVETNEKIFLYNNLEEKLTSADAMTKNQCASLVSAFFYDSQMQPLGLVVAENQIISQNSQSSLLNGYFSIGVDNEVEISSVEPLNVRIAVQSGPLIMVESDVKNITSRTQENARRVVAATDNSNNIYFIAIYNTRNPVGGPNLEELPNIISEVNDANNLNLESAINLDGGSHSAFVTEFNRLTEISTIGGYFCIKP